MTSTDTTGKRASASPKKTPARLGFQASLSLTSLAATEAAEWEEAERAYVAAQVRLSLAPATDWHLQDHPDYAKWGPCLEALTAAQERLHELVPATLAGAAMQFADAVALEGGAEIRRPDVRATIKTGKALASNPETAPRTWEEAQDFSARYLLPDYVAAVHYERLLTMVAREGFNARLFLVDAIATGASAGPAGLFASAFIQGIPAAQDALAVMLAELRTDPAKGSAVLEEVLSLHGWTA